MIRDDHRRIDTSQIVRDLRLNCRIVPRFSERDGINELRGFHVSIDLRSRCPIKNDKVPGRESFGKSNIL